MMTLGDRERPAKPSGVTGLRGGACPARPFDLARCSQTALAPVPSSLCGDSRARGASEAPCRNGESSGKLHAWDEWKPVEKDSIAYGYYLQVTTLQLARAYAAIASGGTLPSVRIERAKGSPDGDWHRLASGRGHRAMSARSAELLTEWLKDVVEGDRGSGAAAAVHGYSVAGKTGTAWVGKDRGGYLEGVHRATFAGFAPAENPRAVVVVTFDQASRNGTGGGSVAAPCFSKVMAETLRLLRVPPSDLRVADADDVARGGRG